MFVKSIIKNGSFTIKNIGKQWNNIKYVGTDIEYEIRLFS